METKGIKLSTWARSKGLTYKGAYRMLKANQMPCKWEQLPTGTIVVYPENIKKEMFNVVIYGRVSSHDQKEDLNRQLSRLRDFASANGYIINKEYSEIGSGLNGKRPKLIKILKDETITHILIEHKDRLVRFGFAYINAATDKKILVVNEAECKDDLVQDFIDIVTSMCSRIYGKRSAKNRAKKALKAANENS